MIYVLDTDILSLLGHRDSPEAPRIHRRIVELPAEHLVVTTIVNYEEQLRGWMAMLGRAKNLKSEVAVYDRLLRHVITFQRMNVLGYDETAANIAEHLKKNRVKISSMDLKIASIVLANRAILITRNAADFRQIPDLHIEDWSSDFGH